jgi:hypothetical protein
MPAAVIANTATRNPTAVLSIHLDLEKAVAQGGGGKAITCTYASSTDKQENSSKNNTLKLGCSGRGASSRNHLFPHLGTEQQLFFCLEFRRTALHCTSSSLWKLPDKRTTLENQRFSRERIYHSCCS